MKRKYIIIPLILFQFIVHFSNAQNELKFNLVEGINGKPLGKINAISQDPHGYIWLCGSTERCIYRYDGSTMTAFRHDDANSNSLGLITLETVYADDEGLIWIGGQGLDQYNPETGIFTHYKHARNDTGGVDGNLVYSILKDHLGRLWIGTGNGLDLLDQKTGKFIHYSHEPGNPKSLSSNVIWRIYEDRAGVIWLATGYPFFNRDPEDGGLNRLNKDGTFTRFMHDPKDPHSLINNKVAAVFEDNTGTFWVGTGGDGLHTMDRNTGKFERYLYDRKHPDRISCPPLHSKDINDKITFITGDNSGSLWIGTMYSGISRYDAITKKITHFENSNGFPDTKSWNTFTSREGALWITTESGNLFRVDPFHASVKNITTNHLVSNFLEDHEGYLWVGTREGGLFKYDKQLNLIRNYKHDSSDSSSLVDNNIGALFQNEENTIWVGTDIGLRILNTTTHKFSRFQVKDHSKNFPDSSITHIIQDKDEITWFSTWGKGLFSYNPKDKSFKQFISNAQDSFSISSSEVGVLMIDQSGIYWAGGSNGINRFDLKTERFKHYLPKHWAVQLFQDSKQNIWVGTEGLFQYNPKEDKFSVFFDPLQEINSVIVGGMVEDTAKNLWLPSERGIIKLNSFTKEIFIFGSGFGIDLRSLVLWGKVFQNRKGQLFFPHDHGFYTFYPEELKVNSNFTINISDFFINSIRVIPGITGPIKKSVEETSIINLKYNQNNISFNFAAIDYRAPEVIKYAYMLEGYNQDWQMVQDKKEKSSSYFNLPRGHYIYRVKAFNKDGTKAEKTILIHINPPWWQTWWAYSSYVLLLMIAIWAFIRWRTDTLQKEKTILEEKVVERTRELKEEKEIVEHTLKELKSTQALLIQSEKMASLGELTAGIAHEIQNPLNFVKNFSEINKELIEELRNEQKNETRIPENETELINHIDHNLEKILHHGKRADSIVKGMLQHTQTNSGQKEPTDINALADEYLRLAYQGMRAKDKTLPPDSYRDGQAGFNAKLETDFDENIGKINIVSQDIGRVLVNVFNNAFYAVHTKYLEKTASSNENTLSVFSTEQLFEPTVSVSTKKIGDSEAKLAMGSSPSYKVQIRIKDNGNGIPQKILDKIFQPFFTTKPTGQGTGLGLSLSYDIIKAHGGEIRVETKEGEGSTFYIVLPI